MMGDEIDVVAIDVSGSVHHELINGALAWTEQYAQENNVHLLVFSHRIHYSYSYSKRIATEVAQAAPSYGGGTVLRPVLDAVLKMVEKGINVKRLILLWDGQAYDANLTFDFPIPIIAIDSFTDELTFPNLVPVEYH